jgi:hypothetical protein
LKAFETSALCWCEATAGHIMNEIVHIAIAHDIVVEYGKPVFSGIVYVPYRIFPNIESTSKAYFDDFFKEHRSADLFCLTEAEFYKFDEYLASAGTKIMIRGGVLAEIFQFFVDTDQYKALSMLLRSNVNQI